MLVLKDYEAISKSIKRYDAIKFLSFHNIESSEENI